MIVRKNAYFTLSELLMGLLIFSFISVSIFTTYQVGTYVSMNGIANLNTYNIFKKEYRTLVGEIRNAKTVSIVDNQLYIANDNGDEIVYTYDSNTIFKNGSPFIQNVKEFIITQENAILIKAHIVLTYKNKEVSPPIDLYIHKRH